MSRRKQTKPFKVEDEFEPRGERKTRPRKILAKTAESQPTEIASSQSDATSENFSDDGEDEVDSATRRSRRLAKCNQCGKMLASALSLARHRLTHSEKKPYQCPKCESSFKTSSNMHRHLRIHFRELNGEPEEPPKPPPSIRTPRQNIRRPNKFKEFDVHLVGQGQRTQTTNARSYSKPKSETVEKDKVTPQKSANADDQLGEDAGMGDGAVEHDSGDDIPDLTSPTKGLKVVQAAAKIDDTDLVCHVCHKTFISKFGLMTHAISHPDLSTRCNICDQGFATHKGLVMHNVIVHKIVESRNENNSSKTSLHLQGFEDLVSVEFSADKFPLIAQVLCGQIQHRHPERDTQHIFVCKKCDKAFPLLRSLELHINKEHCNGCKNIETKDETQGDNTSFLQSVGLCKLGQESLSRKVEDFVSHKANLQNGIDDDAIYASPTVATDSVPSWLRDAPDLSIAGYKDESELPVKRPRLMMKIVRKRSSPASLSPNGEAEENTGNENAEGYFIDGASSKGKKKSSGSGKGGKASGNNPSASRFSSPNKQLVPVNSLSGERNVFWCRICNYSSHEKSALVRHLLTHSGIRPYFCKICNYAFTTKANCERHVRKRHNCKDKAELDATVQCDWEMLKKAPRDDIYMITGSNSACPVCAKTFSCNNDLKEHLKVHEERLFICQLCNIRCTTRNNCVRHILHKHPGIPHQEANTIITFAGSKSKNLDLQKLPDILKDRADIDISRGSLGGRGSSKTYANSRFKRRTEDLLEAEAPRKRQKTTPQSRPTHEAIIDEVAASAHNEADETLMSAPHKDDNNVEHRSPKRNAKKTLPLIPLLKIKAYNDAMAGAYASMLSMYQGLNFFKNFLDNAKDAQMDLGDNTVEMGDTSKDGSLPHLEQVVKTVYSCHTCSATFHTEEDFNCHAASCLGSEAENPGELFAPEEYQVFGRLDDSAQHQGNVFATESRADYQATSDSQNESLLESYPTHDTTSDGSVGAEDSRSGPNPYASPQGAPLSRVQSSGPEQGVTGSEDVTNFSSANSALTPGAVFESDFQNVGDWVDSVALHSPNSSGKSTGTPTQSDYSLPFVNNSPRVFANNKESSYVEDSLLMSMFGDDLRRDDAAVNSSPSHDNLMSVSRYSASFPTMVNMDNPALSRIKYNDTPLDDNKMLVPSKGRFYTARKCPQCDKTFPWASSLRRHIMTHTGLKLYMCRLCKMRFTTRSNLIRHVYRRHGMAKQHPDFASCLAKLHPSDTLLKEVEADVRRRFDSKKVVRAEDIEIEQESNPDEEDYQEEPGQVGKKRAATSDFQSMLEEDPETMLVDLDYSPRDDLPLEEVKKPKARLVVKSPMVKRTDVQLSTEDVDADPDPEIDVPEILSSEMDSPAPDENATESSQDEVEQEQPIDMSLTNSVTEEQVAEEEEPAPEAESANGEVTPYHASRKSRRSMTRSSLDKTALVETPPEVCKGSQKPKMRNKQSTQFVCGLCKKIFKTVPDLIEHLDTHNVPHSWHCPVCGVPFTNKYNCQRHLTRRHGAAHVEPLYVEDSKHGPRTARGHPRKMPPALEDGTSGLTEGSVV